MALRVRKTWVVAGSGIIVVAFVAFALGTAAGESPYAARKDGYQDGFTDAWCLWHTGQGNSTDPDFGSPEMRECRAGVTAAVGLRGGL